LSVIVISDVHLGSTTSNHTDFSRFIDWMAALEKEGGKTIKLNGKELLLKPPEKLILLGDILELWSPQDEDIKYTVQRSIEPFGKLVGLGCEKIFVLGNHDEDVADYLDVVMKLKGKEDIKENTFKINNAGFKIINCHYPEDPEDRKKGFL
jgi:UDP-2,3-diacylglucosamine pyrophosphatase LpxH